MIDLSPRPLSLACLLALPSFAQELPPWSVLRDANRGAEAVVYAEIKDFAMPKGAFMRTTISIRKVYRGPLVKGTELSYSSFKEEPEYPKAFLEHGIIVFLTSRVVDGQREWGQAEEFFEFEYSPRMERAIQRLVRKKGPPSKVQVPSSSAQ